MATPLVANSLPTNAPSVSGGATASQVAALNAAYNSSGLGAAQQSSPTPGSGGTYRVGVGQPQPRTLNTPTGGSGVANPGSAFYQPKAGGSGVIPRASPVYDKYSPANWNPSQSKPWEQPTSAPRGNSNPISQPKAINPAPWGSSKGTPYSNLPVKQPGSFGTPEFSRPAPLANSNPLAAGTPKTSIPSPGVTPRPGGIGLGRLGGGVAAAAAAAALGLAMGQSPGQALAGAAGGLAGGLVGGMLGGPVGAFLGQMAGSALGQLAYNLWFPPQTRSTPTASPDPYSEPDRVIGEDQAGKTFNITIAFTNVYTTTAPGQPPAISYTSNSSALNYAVAPFTIVNRPVTGGVGRELRDYRGNTLPLGGRTTTSGGGVTTTVEARIDNLNFTPLDGGYPLADPFVSPGSSPFVFLPPTDQAGNPIPAQPIPQAQPQLQPQLQPQPQPGNPVQPLTPPYPVPQNPGYPDMPGTPTFPGIPTQPGSPQNPGSPSTGTPGTGTGTGSVPNLGTGTSTGTSSKTSSPVDSDGKFKDGTDTGQTPTMDIPSRENQTPGKDGNCCPCPPINLAPIDKIAEALGASEFPSTLPLLTGDGQMTVNNLPELVIWAVKNIDAVTGKFPTDIEYVGSDGQKRKVVIQSMGHAIEEIFGALLVIGEDADAAVNIGARNAIESIQSKISARQSGETLKAIVKFLGFAGEAKQRTVKIGFTPSATGANNKLENQEMAEFLEPSEQNYIGFECVEQDEMLPILKRILFDAEVARTALYHPIKQNPANKEEYGITGEYLRSTKKPTEKEKKAWEAYKKFIEETTGAEINDKEKKRNPGEPNK